MTNKQIATWLRQCAKMCPNMDDAMGGRIALNPPGTRLTIQCDYDRATILRVAEKYNRGLRRGSDLCSHAPPSYSVPSTRRPNKPSMRVFRQFWEDGEYGNAREYLGQYSAHDWPEEATRLIDEREPAHHDH